VGGAPSVPRAIIGDMPDRNDHQLADDLIATLTAARGIERDLIGGLPPQTRDVPGPDGGWSPKDVQAHLTAWKARQTERLAAARRGEVVASLPEEEIDRVNAGQYEARAGWSWSDVADEADRVAEDFAAALRAIEEETLTSAEPLLGGSMGNGASHTLEHLAPLARDHGREGRVLAFANELEEIVGRSALPDSDKGVFLYNQACFHALGGRLDAARGLLPEAFRLRPDLVAFAPQDADLAELHGELQQMGGAHPVNH